MYGYDMDMSSLILLYVFSGTCVLERVCTIAMYRLKYKKSVQH